MPLAVSHWSLTSIVLLVIACLISLFSDKLIFRNVTHRENVSIVIFEFENFANDLVGTVSNACKLSSKVFVYSETFIYPAVDFSKITDCHIEVIEKQKSPTSSYLDLSVHFLINSSYVLVIPDSTRVIDSVVSTVLSTFADQLGQSDWDGLLFPIHSNQDDPITTNIACRHLRFDAKRWTLHYEPEFVEDWSQSCELIHGQRFALLVRTDAFFRLHRPVSRPFAHSFSIQSHIANLSIQLVNNEKLFVQGGELFSTERLRAKHARLEQYRMDQLYHLLGIKKVYHSSGKAEWHGCDRQTPRCFGTIVDDVPEYLIQRRWTPPCCLRNLEITGRYVFELLEKFAVRYWIEGGSLLGAARNGQIIEWDYDIDIGVYREDCAKLSMLERLFSSEPGSQMEDGQGFLWEKAVEGDFVKVHFSRFNRMHVDIFAFEAMNGTMTKHTWFEDHPQDMPFPEHYLKPLTKVNFIGVQASAPNNVRQFLEMKFGEGVIENAKYPRDVPGFEMN